MVAGDAKVMGSLRRALMAFSCQVEIITDEDSLRGEMGADRNALILLFQGGAKAIEYWLWDIIRVKYFNPVLMIGSEDEAMFREEHSECIHAECNHGYMCTPFGLNRFRKCVADEELTPIGGEDELESIYRRFSKEPARLHEELHRFHAGSDPKILDRIRKFFQKQNDSVASKEIDKIKSQMRPGKWTTGSAVLVGEIGKRLSEYAKQGLKDEKENSVG